MVCCLPDTWLRDIINAGWMGSRLQRQRQELIDQIDQDRI